MEAVSTKKSLEKSDTSLPEPFVVTKFIICTYVVKVGEENVDWCTWRQQQHIIPDTVDCRKYETGKDHFREYLMTIRSSDS